MNRYKFTTDGLLKAAKFLKDKAKTGPAWAKKYKDHLKVVGGRVEYKGLPIIADTKVDDYLRNQMFKKDGTLPFGRDAAHHLLKQRVVGVTRRHLMRFIKAQAVFEQTKAAVPQAKRKAGPKLKKYTFETDLIFIRKGDLVKSNRRFDDTVDKFETYIVSTVEKSTGVCRLGYVKTKLSSVVTPVVLSHIRDMAKELGAKPKDCAYRSDSGTEFDLTKIRAVIPDAETVVLGSSVEKKNQDAQRVFYRILKSRRSVTIPDALKQTQTLLNSTYNRIHGGTPNELIAKAGPKAANLKKYNDKRATHIKGDNRKPFEVGQRVRIVKKKEKGGDIGYKSYKGITYSKQVYVVRKITNTIPRKYWVNRRWLLQEKLLGTELEDEKTHTMIEERDKQQTAADKKADEKHAAERKEKEAVMEVVREAEIQEGTRRRTRRTSRRTAGIEKRRKREAEMKALDEYLASQDDAPRRRRVVRRV